MNYQETVNYLFNVTPVFEKIGAGAYKAGLENTLLMDEHFGHPHRKFKTIHIAGTNGKGSCSHTLAAILQSAGMKVGLYTSPHLVDFRERIRVNGQTISEKDVVDFVEKERSFFEPLRPSFFELTTAMAFKYFAEQEVDVAVIEVGLGGRLDCTNIITPILSVITNISFDHTQFLGDTLASIASEKAGIIKDGVPVVIGEATTETRPVFEARALEKGAPIIFAEDLPEIIAAQPVASGGMLYETRNFGQLKGELGGLYQVKNANTILKAVSQLPFIGRKDVEAGFAHVSELTGLVGRWQKMQEHPTVICDTGHNVGGWIYLSEQLKQQECRQMRIVFGMVDDKDIDSVMELLPKDATYYFTKGTTKRAINEEKVYEKAQHHGLKGEKYPDVKTAYEAALKDASAEDFIFVGGSSYIVSDFLFTCF
jgi:dihydrofolate synthase/folylpolyglutamate synthase